ncbi:hypothetical protein HG536_0B04060 [Torulaspora globosa]|uniref:Uncharacterized protein n=1 Tax=Torulaspora globosa TaxID=48254 RepID=A0A7G3ZDF6_9SACH|nr:uncharacterized protein HG536_0B04060 [Torulaspora globosa]QLL31542.1 hypothetical protein HG536_0B04060 [Torulaspora globosa]
MAFLTLTSEVQTPFIIPEISPVSPASSRKNSTLSVSPVATNVPAPSGRKGSISLL